MSDYIFNSLLIHTCDIQTAATGSASDSSYGHETPTFSAPQAVKLGVSCRLMQLSSDEMIKLGMSSEAMSGYNLYLLPADVPTGLRPRSGLGTHQVVNVRRKRGTALVDAGPFDITGVIEPSAMEHHFKLVLSRTP